MIFTFYILSHIINETARAIIDTVRLWTCLRVGCKMDQTGEGVILFLIWDCPLQKLYDQMSIAIFLSEPKFHVLFYCSSTNFNILRVPD